MSFIKPQLKGKNIKTMKKTMKKYIKQINKNGLYFRPERFLIREGLKQNTLATFN